VHVVDLKPYVLGNGTKPVSLAAMRLADAVALTQDELEQFK
jgi:hypothetical protein